jgi:hypothetical protein
MGADNEDAGSCSKREDLVEDPRRPHAGDWAHLRGRTRGGTDQKEKDHC